MKEFEVKIPATKAGSYKICIGNRMLDSLWDRIEADFAGLSKFLITDENLVSAGHLESLLGQRSVPSFVITTAGETSKDIDTVVSII